MLLGILEAKKVTVDPRNVLEQAKRYAAGCSNTIGRWGGFNVPFLFASNGTKIWFADAEQPLKAWFREAGQAHWSSPNELKQQFPSSSILSSNRFVFNIKGNTYRLIAMINFDYGQVFIRFVGTHAEYDKIDATMI
jgi:mRNA interferase HigB